MSLSLSVFTLSVFVCVCVFIPANSCCCPRTALGDKCKWKFREPQRLQINWQHTRVHFIKKKWSPFKHSLAPVLLPLLLLKCPPVCPTLAILFVHHRQARSRNRRRRRRCRLPVCPPFSAFAFALAEHQSKRPVRQVFRCLCIFYAHAFCVLRFAPRVLYFSFAYNSHTHTHTETGRTSS